jgi:hypothetical protein
MILKVMESFYITFGMAVSETYSLNIQTSKRNNLKNLIDTCRHTLFIFLCFGWGLNSRCWSTNQG